ncbi:MAG: hypothetical protein Aurels2KO_21900 [Aureliella sp.]
MHLPMSPTSKDKPRNKKVTIFTDGGAAPNPGKGGYGVVLRSGKRSKELSGGYALTTNNRMELMAVIVGLEALKKRCIVTLYSDSKYIVDAIRKGSVFEWRDNNWSLNAIGSKKAKNPDLWTRLLAAYDKHDVEMEWVKGHAGIADNERCDQLATSAMYEPNLPTDEGYADNLSSLSLNAQGKPTRSKTKMTEIGQPCRKCLTPVEKRIPKRKTPKPNQRHYFAWYLFCPGCKTMYMNGERKPLSTGDDTRQSNGDTSD